MKVLLIVPAYNEEKNIAQTVARIRQAQQAQAGGMELDYVVINDGSSDGTEQICRENGFHYVTLIENLGIGGAVQTGYLYAQQHGYDVAVQFDGDGQHDIDSLPQLLAPIAAGEADFTVGSRLCPQGRQRLSVHGRAAHGHPPAFRG